MFSHSMNYGKLAVVSNALGSASAAATLMAIALFGVKQIITENGMYVATISGAIYLLYLGTSSALCSKKFVVDKISTGRKKFFTQSFFAGICNPKDIIFFIVFLPQFVDQKIPLNESAAKLIAGWVVCDILIISGYGALGIKAGKSLTESTLTRVTRLMGLIVATIGLLIFISTISKIF